MLTPVAIARYRGADGVKMSGSKSLGNAVKPGTGRYQITLSGGFFSEGQATHVTAPGSIPELPRFVRLSNTQAEVDMVQRASGYSDDDFMVVLYAG